MILFAFLVIRSIWCFKFTETHLLFSIVEISRVLGHCGYSRVCPFSLYQRRWVSLQEIMLHFLTVTEITFPIVFLAPPPRWSSYPGGAGSLFQL